MIAAGAALHVLTPAFTITPCACSVQSFGRYATRALAEEAYDIGMLLYRGVDEAGNMNRYVTTYVDPADGKLRRDLDLGPFERLAEGIAEYRRGAEEDTFPEPPRRKGSITDSAEQRKWRLERMREMFHSEPLQEHAQFMKTAGLQGESAAGRATLQPPGQQQGAPATTRAKPAHAHTPADWEAAETLMGISGAYAADHAEGARTHRAALVGADAAAAPAEAEAEAEAEAAGPSRRDRSTAAARRRRSGAK